MKLTIINLYDSTDCETCGSSGAEGYRVLRDGEPLVELKAIAHCHSGQRTYDEHDLLREVLKAFGHDVLVESGGEEPSFPEDDGE